MLLECCPSLLTSQRELRWCRSNGSPWSSVLTPHYGHCIGQFVFRVAWSFIIRGLIVSVETMKFISGLGNLHPTAWQLSVIPITFTLGGHCGFSGIFERPSSTLSSQQLVHFESKNVPSPSKLSPQCSHYIAYAAFFFCKPHIHHVLN